jgi:hypothetical protein
MPRKVSCDRCHNVLMIAEEEGDARLTCPRCLARVVNPVALAQGEILGNAERVRDEPEAPHCPECGEAVRNNWQYCPACRALLRGRRRAGPRAGADRDVRFDMAWVAGGLVLLALLGVIGMVSYLIRGGFESMSFDAILATGAALLLVAGIGTGLGFASKHGGAKGGIGLAGGLTIMLILLGLPIAMVIGLLIACSNGCQQVNRPPAQQGKM